MRTLLIKILFKLLKVNYNTRHLVPVEDLKILKPNEGAEIVKKLNFKYDKALSSVLAIPGFVEWLYLQVIDKQREHIMTLDKSKRDTQVATILFILFLINEIQEADKRLKKFK
jgi:hypothetical protein